MKLRFLGKESKPNDSPTLYATDSNSYIVQGYIVTDPAILAQFDLTSDETLVEVPARLMIHLDKDGLSGIIERPVPPIVHIKADGNFIMRGPRVIDPETLSQMSIPSHETAIAISKSSVLTLLAGV
ncbi:MAG TPA: hypothetical protein VH637_14650 [Streptosporangiaceae bacterium]|jgi:hypothetical protein